MTSRLRSLLVGKVAVSGPKGLGRGKIDADKLEEISPGLWWQIALEDEKAMAELEAMRRQFDEARKRLDRRFEDKVDKLQRGDELPPGVMKMVKVFVAVKRKLQPGDKMAGRHGNKGVISKILPIEDMPYLENGTHVDIVLNPLGVPSPHERRPDLRNPPGLGRPPVSASRSPRCWKPGRTAASARRWSTIWSDTYGKDEELPESDEELLELARNLSKGIPFATPVFDGAHIDDIENLLEKAGLARSGQSYLYDGQTGEQFKRPVTVGYIYMLKLHHLVDDKIHARSIGPYSLVTQQPLGGKAQFGGQRFGEMEVWALEAYGAAYTLQEMLTVKSDDVAGPHQGLRKHRPRRRHLRGRHPGKLQRAGQGNAFPGPQRGAGEQLTRALALPR